MRRETIQPVTEGLLPKQHC